MKRSARLKHLRNEVDTRQAECRQRVLRAEQRVRDAQTRLAELRHYCEEYARGFEGRLIAGIGGAGFRDYQAFLARLEEAVRQQIQHLARSEAELEQERERWREAAVQVKAVESVTQRWCREEAVAAQRVEQKLTDEHALDAARRSERENT
jgi:flagellar FliJ protein